MLNLFLHQKSCHSVFVGNSYHRAVGSVGGSKGVIYINVTEFSQLVSESCHCLFRAFYFVALIVFVFSFFFGVESNIFAEENFIVGFVDLVENTITDAVFQEGDFSIEE